MEGVSNVGSTQQSWTDWDGFFEAFSEEIPLLTEVAHGMGGITRRLAKIVKLLEESLRLLRLIRQDTKALLEGPYRTAMHWLELARNPSISDSDRSGYLNKASEEFMRSMGFNEHNPVLYSLTGLNAGICWLALDKKEEAVWCLEKGYRAAMNGLEQQWRAFGADPYFTRTTGLVGMGAGAGVAAAVAILAGPIGWAIGGAVIGSGTLAVCRSQIQRRQPILELVDIVNGLRRSLIVIDGTYRNLVSARAYNVSATGSMCLALESPGLSHPA